MASLAYLPLTFLFLLASSLLQIHARELNSFKKDVRNEFPFDTVTKHEETPATAVGGEQPENLPPQSQNGYGLYGRRPEEYFPTNERSSLPTAEYNTKIPDDIEANAFYQQHESQKNNGQYGMSTEIPDGREANAFYQQDETQKNKGQYGMSDTRAFENGKYFYDLNNHRHGEVYDPTRGNFEGYGVKDNGRFGYGVFNNEGRRNGYGYSQEMEGKHNYQRQGIDREEYYDP